jgi:hypothetical protein
MRQLRKRMTRFGQLSAAERLLLLRATFVVASARTGLWVLPLEATRRIAAAVSKGASKGVSKVTAKGPTRHSVEQLVWAVTAVSRYVPAATCLTQALAAQALLADAGYSSRVEIGVAKDEPHRFEAHAWVTCGDQVVIGGPHVARYASLKVLEA